MDHYNALLQHCHMTQHGNANICYRSGSSPESATTTRCVGRPLCVPTASMRRSRSMPLVTLPKTTCLPSRWGAGACAGRMHAELAGRKSQLLMHRVAHAIRGVKITDYACK